VTAADTALADQITAAVSENASADIASFLQPPGVEREATGRDVRASADSAPAVLTFIAVIFRISWEIPDRSTLATSCIGKAIAPHRYLRSGGTAASIGEDFKLRVGRYGPCAGPPRRSREIRSASAGCSRQLLGTEDLGGSCTVD
jgi:hypothetical protein